MKPLDYAIASGEARAGAPAASLDSSQVNLWQLQRWLQQQGCQSSAYFTLQAGVRQFLVEGVGYLSYFPQRTPLGKVNIVFANPICEPKHLPELLTQYFAAVQGRTLFLGVDEKTAAGLTRFGYRANLLGTEFSIPLADFEVAGKHKKQLRHAANLGTRHDLRVREQRWCEVDGDQVRAISSAWRRQKAVSSRELKLLTRPPVFADEWLVRKFYCYQGDKLLGYVFFDPFFREGRVAGYCANILRTWPGVRPSGVLDYILLEAIRQFQEEGVSNLSLGIAPLHGIRPIAGERVGVRNIQQWLYQHANSLYAFQALAYHKSRYRGRETPWYLCSDGMGLPKLALSMLLGTGLLGKRQAEG